MMTNILNTFSMYRLMLWYLVFLVASAIVLSFFKILPLSAGDIFFETVYLLVISYLANRCLAWIFRVRPNPESSVITALILSLILGPAPLFANLGFFTFAALASQTSKYVLAYGRRHIFNPAALGAVSAAVVLGKAASWWVGSASLLPLIILGGVLILRKIGRFEMVGMFLGAYFLLTIVTGQFISSLSAYAPLMFFSLVMIVEPMTSPRGRTLYLLYAAGMAVVLLVFQKFSEIPYTLELSLLVGNVFAFVTNLTPRLTGELTHREEIASNAFGFWFKPQPAFFFLPGQYVEWSLPHGHADSRGIRRYFTIASSPTEKEILLATKFTEKSSSFKNSLRKLKPGEKITATGPGGEFVLPKDPHIPLVFIAGGIGITPFRGIMKYLLDQNQKRDILLLYSNRTSQDIAFREIFDEAEKKLGLRTIYVNTDTHGYITAGFIKKHVPEWDKRVFYVSGPEPMVKAFQKMLGEMGVKNENMKRDYFPGYTETHQ